MPTRIEIEQQIAEIICDELGVDNEEILPEARFMEDLGADSLDVIELTMAFEEKFGVAIDDATAEGLLTVKDVVDYLENRV